LAHHRCMREIPAGQVVVEIHRALAGRGAAL
jgi:hypothetical protein